jgi:hypothetical protein
MHRLSAPLDIFRNATTSAFRPRGRRVCAVGGRWRSSPRDPAQNWKPAGWNRDKACTQVYDLSTDERRGPVPHPINLPASGIHKQAGLSSSTCRTSRVPPRTDQHRSAIPFPRSTGSPRASGASRAREQFHGSFSRLYMTE